MNKIKSVIKNQIKLKGKLNNAIIYIEPKLQEKTITPKKEEQIIMPDSGFDAINKITVESVTSNIDNNIVPENIKNGVDILGVTGNYIGGKYAPRAISFQYYGGTELDAELANLDISNLTSMSYMFSYCQNLTSLDLSNFNTSNVTSMFGMFNYCEKLTDLDISNFDTSNVTDIHQMFYSCFVKNLNLGNFDASKVNSTSNLFSCRNLTNIYGSLNNLGQSYDTSKFANYIDYKLDLSKSTLLTEQSIINILNGLYDIKTKGCKTQSVVLGSTNLAKLTSEAGQAALTQAQNYGWTVS